MFIKILLRLKSNYYDDSIKLVVFKMKNETDGVAIEQLVGLKPKIYSLLVDGNSGKGVNKNVVARISHNEHKDLLLNNTYKTHLINRIQTRCNRTGTYKIKKIPLSYFDDKIQIQNNVYDGLALGCQS